MKNVKIYFCLALALMLGPVMCSHANSIENDENIIESTRGNELSERIKEIQAMDFSSLDGADRKVLREEVKEIKKEIKSTQESGLYLSTGAIIIIILLLIILL